jgi:Xaa-Pro aminopeptidase
MATTRINQLKARIRQDNLDALVITYPNQIRYLTGFSGDTAVLVITPTQAELMADFRFKDQAHKQTKGAKVNVTKGDSFTGLKDHRLLCAKNARVGFSSEQMSVGARERLARHIPNALLVAADSTLFGMGWVKDSAELKEIKKAVHIADVAFSRVLALVRPGVGENELAAELEYQMMMLGSEKPAFESIIASGYRSAMPHGVATLKKVQKGDFVTFDFGATVNGFVSDCTRTVVVGKASERQKKVYNIVAKAQLAAIHRVKAGIEAKAVDAAARAVITKAGYGKEFGHGTGHGIGFYIHMGPRVSQVSQDKLMVNNVITIEPGVYVSGWGGVRIEDDVVVTKSGCTVLNRAEKKLLEL